MRCVAKNHRCRCYRVHLLVLLDAFHLLHELYLCHLRACLAFEFLIYFFTSVAHSMPFVTIFGPALISPSETKGYYRSRRMSGHLKIANSKIRYLRAKLCRACAFHFLHVPDLAAPLHVCHPPGGEPHPHPRPQAATWANLVACQGQNRQIDNFTSLFFSRSRDFIHRSFER